jgi:protein-tyrosine phosphatase
VTSALAGEERILDWEGALNARDTGGLPTADGRRVRRGALVRSDVLSRLTPSGRAALVAHGIRTVVDVRTSEEIGRDVDYPFRDTRREGDPDYVNVSFVIELSQEQEAFVRERRERAQRLGELNRMDIDVHRAGIGAVVGAIADAGDGGVLVHCYAGKDRTGITVALLLALVGVSDEDIADDYALTMLNLDPLISEWLETIADHDERERMRELASPRREAMLETLAYVEERYGGAEEYLLGAGVTPEQIARLRERLVATT